MNLKKWLHVIMAVLTVSFAATFNLMAEGEEPPSKIDPLLRMIQSEPAPVLKGLKAFGVKAVAGGESTTEVIIKFGEGITEPDAREIIASCGGMAHAVIGDIVTATIPISSITMLEGEEDIVYIEAARPVSPKLNQSVVVTHAYDVHVNSPATTYNTAYKGTGTLVGIVDSGIDCQHPDFFDAAGNPRIQYYWDQSLGTTGVTEIAGSSGTEYSPSQMVIGGACTNSPDTPPSLDGIGHGTHVAGIAASGNTKYTGIAPSAQLLIVKYSVADSDSSGAMSTSLLNAVSYLFQKAQKLQKPIVVNMSLGTSLGAHDNKSLLEAGLNNLILNSNGSEKQGRAIVNAAGNEALSPYSPDPDLYDKLGGIHATINNSTSGMNYGYRLMTPGASSSLVRTGIWVDVWQTANNWCPIWVNAYKISTGSTVLQMTSSSAIQPGSTSGTKTSTDGNIEVIVNYTDSVNTLNGKSHALIYINRSSTTVPTPSSTVLNNYYYDVILQGACTGDMWLYPDSTGYNDFTLSTKGPVPSGYSLVSGDSLKTITIPGTASGVITAASYLASTQWQDVNLAYHSQTVTTGAYGATGTQQNAISVYSSLGPIAGASPAYYKPDLTAPGEPIMSTLASNISVDNEVTGTDSVHQKLQGTSMSAPHVAGTVALMFEVNKCLLPTTIKTKLHDTSLTNSGQSAPNTTWGYGKLNSWMAVNSVVQDTTCTWPSNEADKGGEGSSCSSTDQCKQDYTCTGGVCVGTGGTGKTCSLNRRGTFEVYTVIFFALTAGVVIVLRMNRRSLKRCARS